MEVGVGVGVGEGDEGGLEEIDPLPPHAQTMTEINRRQPESKFGKRFELSEELIGGRLFTEPVGICLRLAEKKRTIAWMLVVAMLGALGKLRCSHLGRQLGRY